MIELVCDTIKGGIIMQNKRVLHVSICCESLFKDETYQRLFRYSKKIRADKIEPLVLIHIDDLDTQEEMLSIQEMLYDTVVITNISLNITSSSELYAALLTLIQFSLAHLEQIGYHHLGDSLIIFASPTETDDTLYNFEWAFTN